MPSTPSPRSLVKSFARLAGVAVSAGLLANCGGGGSSIGGSSIGLPASSALAQLCAAPRPAGTIDPFTGTAYGDILGTPATEKAFLRSWTDETYLWYQDVRALSAATLNAAMYATPIDYFDALKTPRLDAAGQPKDKFHFTYDTQQWADLALNGTSWGYGFEVALTSTTQSRSAIVAYTDDGSPTGQQSIARGAAIVTVDGEDLATSNNVATLNAGLFPTQGGTHFLEVRDLGSSTTRTVQVTAQQIVETPVQNVKTLPAPNDMVGYMLFNDHIATAEPALINAINTLKAANITDLVLDIRYNGGGYLDIASELAYMIGGSKITSGAYFERLQYNDRNPFNVTTAQATTAFHMKSQGFSGPSGQDLPTLNLNRVYVLTTGDTCSASEAIVNGLRGAGVTVHLIGDWTCGKPYGFYPRDNCSTTYFTIQFKGVNNAGFGDYAEGFQPTCAVADDFGHALGDPLEAQLNMALGWRASGNSSCTPLVATGKHILAAKPAPRGSLSAGPPLARNPLRENRIYRPN